MGTSYKLAPAEINKLANLKITKCKKKGVKDVCSLTPFFYFPNFYLLIEKA